MTQIFNRYATPFITWFFIISLISGLALYFHIGPTGFREMHEILSLLLILPFVLVLRLEASSLNPLVVSWLGRRVFQQRKSGKSLA